MKNRSEKNLKLKELTWFFGWHADAKTAWLCAGMISQEKQ
jgi:hypothetical protein